MNTASFLRTAVTVSVLCTMIACGAAPPIDSSVDTTKLPVTTCSEKAHDAYLKGRWLAENLRITDAHEYYLKAIEADPDFALAYFGAAITAPTNQEFFDALRSAVDTCSNVSEGERFLIAALEAGVAGEPEVQLAKLEALVALFPEDERAHNTIGNFYFGQQDYEHAISSYREAIDINPKYASPYNMLGYALRQMGDYAGAETAFQRYAELIPDQPNPYDSYAELLMRMGRYDESIAGYKEALAIDPNFVASYVGIGTNQMFLGDFDEARSSFSKIEENARNNGERRQACFWRAAAYLHEGNFEDAFAEIQKMYDIASETDDQSSMAGDLNLMGDLFLRAGRVDEAAEKYHAQIEMMEGSSDATAEVKEATARNQKYDLTRIALWRADLDLAKGLANEYRDEVAAHNIRFEVQRTHELDGMIALAEGSLDTALDHFEKANLQDPQIWLLKARTYAALGDEEGARRACEEVINFNQLNFNLAYVRSMARELLETL